MIRAAARPAFVALAVAAAAGVPAGAGPVVTEEYVPTPGLLRIGPQPQRVIRLTEEGFTSEDIERAVALATQKSYPNPRDVTQPGLRALLTNAVDGRRPAENQHD